MRKPLAVDLFSGLFGWSAGLVREGWTVVGIDLEDMHEALGMVRPREYGLIIQDVLTVSGSALSGADLIVASPPCQFFSYVAMPWSRGKVLAAKVRADPALLEKELALFNACFRIQAEASAAAGRHIPMVVENVRGAIPWVGRSRWNFGSYHLWGDVPALMPETFKGVKGKPYETGNKNDGGSWFNIAHNTTSGVGQNPDGRKLAGFRFDGSGRSFQSASVEHMGVKAPGMNWSDRTKGERLSFTDIAGRNALAGTKFTIHKRGEGPRDPVASAHGKARKAASAMIARIPEPLARHIAKVYFPREIAP